MDGYNLIHQDKISPKIKTSLSSGRFFRNRLWSNWPKWRQPTRRTLEPITKSFDKKEFEPSPIISAASMPLVYFADNNWQPIQRFE